MLTVAETESSALPDLLAATSDLLQGSRMHVQVYTHVKLALKPPVYKDHMRIRTTSFSTPEVYFHVIECVYKDHLCIKSTLFWSLGWSLYASFTVLY